MTFEEFFLDHYGDVVRSVTLMVGNRSAAEDLTQDAFARAFQHWRRVRDMERPVGWVYVVALNGVRRAWRRDRMAEGDADQPPVGDLAGSVVTVIQVEEALALLTPRQRAAVVLRYFADLPIADIAAALDCAPGTVKATLHQSLRRLRVEMGDDDSED
jgi:RNA polymerase sigma-70 factor (ECF subfamily)